MIVITDFFIYILDLNIIEKKYISQFNKYGYIVKVIFF